MSEKPLNESIWSFVPLKFVATPPPPPKPPAPDRLKPQLISCCDEANDNEPRSAAFFMYDVEKAIDLVLWEASQHSGNDKERYCSFLRRGAKILNRLADRGGKG